MFTEEQIKQLSAPLNRRHVKSRKQGGRAVSYVEGWHAIDEANRIFGFGEWSRETVDIRCVSERERAIGDSASKGWGVTYTARVRVRVGEIVREGCGAGHGIDRDLGQAHESAIKEAETDGMKRALMTFGNPFGLALYDKEQGNVADGATEENESKARFIAECKATIAKFTTPEAVANWWKTSFKQMADRFDLNDEEWNALCAEAKQHAARRRETERAA